MDESGFPRQKHIIPDRGGTTGVPQTGSFIQRLRFTLNRPDRGSVTEGSSNAVKQVVLRWLL